MERCWAHFGYLFGKEMLPKRFENKNNDFHENKAKQINLNHFWGRRGSEIGTLSVPKATFGTSEVDFHIDCLPKSPQNEPKMEPNRAIKHGIDQNPL